MQIGAGRGGLMTAEEREDELERQDAADSPLFNQSLAKAFAILEAFSLDRRSMNLPELATITGLTKSAVQRLTFTLESLGYLRKDPASKRYSVTPRTLELGMRYTTTSSLIESASPYLLDLNITCGETVNLSEPDGLNMIFVATYPGRRQISVQLPVGSRFPIYCTAAGRALLSGLPKNRAEAVLGASDIKSYTPTTILDRAEIARLVDEARTAGFAFAKDEFYRGDINIAAPIRGVDGRAVAAVGVSVPVTRWSFEAACKEIAPQVAATAQNISSLFAPLRPI